MDQDITPVMALNRASHALEAHTSLTMEEHSASIVEVALTQRERDRALSMTVRSKVSWLWFVSYDKTSVRGVVELIKCQAKMCACCSSV